MKLITRIFLNRNHNYIKTELPRLCRRSYYKSATNYTWPLHTFTKSFKKYQCFLSCHRYETNALNKNENIDDPLPYKNEALHSILKNSVHYENTVFPPIKIIPSISNEDITHLYITDWQKESAEHILDALRKLAYYHLNGSMLDMPYCIDILNSCTEKMKELNDPQILNLIQTIIVLRKLIHYERKDYYAFLNMLNKECLIRFFKSDTERLLLLSDGFYQLNDNNSAFMWRALRKLASKPHKLSAKLMVHFIFLIQMPKAKIPLSIFEIEYQLTKCLDELTGDEIGIIAKGFSSYNKTISNTELVSAMIEKVMKYNKTINSICLEAFIKLLKYSRGMVRNQLRNLLIMLRDEVPRLQETCLISIASACARLHVYDKILIDNIIKSLENTVHLYRLQNMGKIVFAISVITPQACNYMDIYHKIINYITINYKTCQGAEIDKYALVGLLAILTVKNLYIPELLPVVFDPLFIQNINGKTKPIKNLLILHCSVKIDLPNYEGLLLSENMYIYLVKKYGYVDEGTKEQIRKIKCEIMFICKNNLGLHAHIDYILPYSGQQFIVLGFDNYNNSVEIEPILSAMPMYSIKKVDSVELKTIHWIILFMLSTSTKVFGHNGYIGHVHRELRHLKTIGYTPILIAEDIWSNCKNENKEKYLESLIYQKTLMFPDGLP